MGWFREKHKLAWHSWSDLCRPKSKGGLVFVILTNLIWLFWQSKVGDVSKTFNHWWLSFWRQNIILRFLFWMLQLSPLAALFGEAFWQVNPSWEMGSGIGLEMVALWEFGRIDGFLIQLACSLYIALWWMLISHGFRASLILTLIARICQH